MKRSALLTALLFLFLWALRLQTLHSAFHPDDSPETATAGAVLGIQHPPGYPLPTLAGRLACLALPGAPALAQNLAASLASCLCVVLLVLWLNLHWKVGLQTSLIAGLGAGLSTQLWFQGLSAKGGLYCLNLLLTFAALACFSRRDPKGAALGFLFAGLGLAGHYMSFIFFLPLMLWWARPHVRKYSWLSLPGLSLYLYLPLRSSLNPALDWGDPDSFSAFIETITRSQYSGQGSPLGFENTRRMIVQFLRLLPDQMPVLALPLAAWGIWAWRKELGLLSLSVALYLAAALFRNAPPAHAPWVANAFFLPAYLFIWFFVALGMERLKAKFQQPAVVVLQLLILFQARSQARQCDYSNDFLYYDYSRDLLEALPKDTVLLAAGGNDAFGVWYQQSVLKRRQDVVLVDVPLISPWYLRQLAARQSALNGVWKNRDELIQHLLSHDLRAPLYYSTHNPGDRGIPLGLVSYAPAPKATVSMNGEALALRWKAVRLRYLADKATPDDGNRGELLQYYPDSAAALESFAGRYQLGALAAYAANLKAQLKGGPQ